MNCRLRVVASPRAHGLRGCWTDGDIADCINLHYSTKSFKYRLVEEIAQTISARRLLEKIGPFILEGRGALQMPRLYSEFDYMYNELMKYLEMHPELSRAPYPYP